MLAVEEKAVQMRAGRNGGWLKSGNTVNVGRKPDAVRDEILETVAEGAALMRAIMDGSFTQEVLGPDGEVVGRREPTIAEVTRVWRVLARHALPKQLAVERPPIVLEPDMDRLSWDDQVRLSALLEKAAGIESEPLFEFEDD